MTFRTNMKFSLNVAKCEIVQRGQKTIYEKFNFFYALFIVKQKLNVTLVKNRANVP